MSRTLLKQKYFATKELRISIALIILWTLLATAFFSFFTKELGEKIGHGASLFIIVMLGYVAIVVVLTLLFAHRLVGPFQRLKTDMRLIRSGEYHRRLHLRKSDDIYIRSFVKEVNIMLDEHEHLQSFRADLTKNIDSELIRIISLIEEGDSSRDKLRENILAFHKKLQSVRETKD